MVTIACNVFETFSKINAYDYCDWISVDITEFCPIKLYAFN